MPDTDAIPTNACITDQLDPHLYESECNRLTEMLDRVNPNNNEYHFTGQRVGWRNRNSTTSTTVTSGQDLVKKLAPGGSFNLDANLDSNHDAIHVSLSHHDSPMGESHVITRPEA